MSTAYHQPRPGHYRLPDGVRIVVQDGSAVAVCDYPLRLVRVSAMAARVLSLCTEECTCVQLAQATNIPVKRVEALCNQLRWKGLLEAGPALPPATWPYVSIVIPSYNRSKELERCLYALFGLDYPAQCLEIIVVDDASTDETRCMLQRMVQEASAHGLEMREVQHAKRQGVGISRNTGAGVGQHELIAYIDSDCVASPGWLKELVPAFQDSQIAAVGGMIRAYDRNTLLGRYEDVCSSLFMGVRPQQLRLEGPLTYLPAANMLIRRTVWQQLAGFVPMTQGEDVDFCRRLLMSGASMNYLPYGVIYHDYRTTLGAFLRIRAAYASAEAALLVRHPGGRRILLLPPEQATFAAAAIGGGWGIIWRYIWFGIKDKIAVFAPLSLLLAFLLTLCGARKRLRKVREQHIAISPLAVLKATLRGHLAYTYHLCRHLTRYYTLPLLAVSLLVPPLLLLTSMLCGIVICVDYRRLRPDMDLGRYGLCSLLDDCAYEVGVVWGCVKHRTWKPLLPSCSWRATSKERFNSPRAGGKA
jgi:mycofactocin glycosyltransferase